MRPVHHYAIDRMVGERQEELRRLGRAESGVRAARRGAERLRWRRRAGRALVDLAVAVSVPPARRADARRQATAVLGFDPPCR